ncbi:hypothetical protein [Spirillospora sp. NPDC029432]|uniref:hypothetical protein n=1 Tax=Spirillospora sp. NPDC029432 TaxID=3154599 RepID=UPI0034546855
MPPSHGVPTPEARGPESAGPEALEARIAELRTAVRRAMARNDRQTARALRAELRETEDAWDDAVLGEPAGAAVPETAAAEKPAPRSNAREKAARGGNGRKKDAGRTSPERGLVPVRDQVHQALTLLGVPAAPKLIGSVYAAFFPGEIPGTRLTSLRRDEERSFRTAPYARPYYLCAALTADLLAPARGLITVSTWPLEQRVVGPLSPRTDFLRAALRVAEHAARGGDPSPDAQRLLWRFASNIPGTPGGPGDRAGTVDPAALAEAAGAELEVHLDADGKARRRAAERARTQLDDAERLFGSRLRAMRAASGTDGRAPGPASGPPAPALRPVRGTGKAKGTRRPRGTDAPAAPAPRPHRTTHEDDR